MTINNKLAMFVDNIKIGARVNNQKTGRYLFNHLPSGAANAIRDTLIDPFRKELTAHEIYMWLDDHLIFDGNRIIALFNDDKILWEAK